MSEGGRRPTRAWHAMLAGVSFSYFSSSLISWPLAEFCLPQRRGNQRALLIIPISMLTVELKTNQWYYFLHVWQIKYNALSSVEGYYFCYTFCILGLGPSIVNIDPKKQYIQKGLILCHCWTSLKIFWNCLTLNASFESYILLESFKVAFVLLGWGTNLQKL